MTSLSITLEAVTVPLLLSLKVAGVATLVAALMGISMAWFAAKREFFGKEVLDAILTLPVVLPPTVLGYYLLVLLGRRGPIGGWLETYFGINLIFTWQGAVIAASIVAFPLVYKSARTAFEGVSRQYEDASRVLGKNEVQVFFLVTFPLAIRGILAGSMLAFARALGEFGATLMVAGSLPGKTETRSNAGCEAVQAGHDQIANFLVVITSFVCIIVLLTSNYFLKPKYREA